MTLQMSGSRIKVAGRFKPCVHLGCFDLDVFLEINQRSRKVNNILYSFDCVLYKIKENAKMEMYIS